MTVDRLAACTFPALASPYAEALHDAVALAMDVTEPIGIIATGTIVRGTPHAASDLDVYVIHDAPYRRRIQRTFHGVPAEIFINPPSAIHKYFVEEHNDGRPITAHMIASGEVVMASSPIIPDLRREAVEWLARRSECSDAQVVRDRYIAATRFEDATDVADTDPATATMLMTQAVIAMLEHDCRVKAGRVPRGKDLLGSIADRDPELGRVAHAFFSAASFADRRSAAEAIGDRTVGARGFFEWDSGAEPVRPTATGDDRAAIDAVRDAWVAAVAAGNPGALADLVTADYDVWADGAPALIGPDIVVKMMSAALARYAVTQSYEPTETVISGNWAFQRGIERIRAIPRDGSGAAQENAQRALILLRRGDDGRWRYARGMTNGLPPVPASESR